MQGEKKNTLVHGVHQGALLLSYTIEKQYYTVCLISVVAADVPFQAAQIVRDEHP